MASFTPINPQDMASNSASTPASAAGSTPDPRTNDLRRPTTIDSTDFWYCGDDKWSQWLSETAASGNTKREITTALNNLRKFDAAGRIMETGDGVVAAVACSWCAREGYGPCMVHKDFDGACAYCKRHSKSGCTASRAASEPTLEERVVALEALVEEQRSELAASQAALAAERERLNEVVQQMIKLSGDHTSLWERVFGSTYL